jgi:hypothetical protein
MVSGVTPIVNFDLCLHGLLFSMHVKVFVLYQDLAFLNA